MTTPTAFSIERVPDHPDGWEIHDDRVAAFWLPLVGPTPYCLLLALHWTLSTEPALTLSVADVADQLGVKAKRAIDSLYRLARFGLIAEDAIFTTYERPRFLLARTVPRISPADWTRLPASIREAYADVAL